MSRGASLQVFCKEKLGSFSEGKTLKEQQRVFHDGNELILHQSRNIIN